MTRTRLAMGWCLLTGSLAACGGQTTGSASDDGPSSAVGGSAGREGPAPGVGGVEGGSRSGGTSGGGAPQGGSATTGIAGSQPNTGGDATGGTSAGGAVTGGRSGSTAPDGGTAGSPAPEGGTAGSTAPDGGTSGSTASEGGTGGVLATGGTAAGGAAGDGGATNTGATTAGGSSGAAAAGGATASAERCTAPPIPGDCSAVLLKYRHDPALGLCVPYLFDTCDSSPNQYATRDECVAACHGGEPDLDACTTAADCWVTSTSCCGPCEPVDTGVLVAVNIDRLTEFRELVDCGIVQCEQCLPVGPNERTSRYAYAACVAGQCVVRDLRDQAIAQCETAADCRLRCGTGCCEDCNADAVVAVRADANVAAELCEGSSVCDACDCAVPPEYAADCVEGRCVAPVGPVCEVGADQTCNASSIMSSIAGTCNADGSCTCNDPFNIDPATGRCW
jgi:hypothetical protein